MTSTDPFQDIARCTLCAPRFAATATRHQPRPIFQYRRGARVAIISQAPGARAHKSGVPFSDPSGVRLRDWLAMPEDVFYDASRVAILPMAFCFPGYDGAGADLPPPKICATTWRARLMAEIGAFEVTLLVGGYAQKHHLRTRAGVTQTVAAWRDHAPALFPLPHPSWRNTAWLKRNPWFAAELLPALRHRLTEVL